MNIIETDRLFLCRLSTNDASFILELLNTDSWLQYIGDKGIRTIDGARNYIVDGPMESYEKHGFGLYLTKLRDSSIPIGICGLLKRVILEDVDIGFAILPEYTGKGYAFESAVATLAYAKNNLGLSRIVAITTEDNQNSIRLLKKLGLRFEQMVSLPNEDKELMLFANQKKINS